MQDITRALIGATDPTIDNRIAARAVGTILRNFLLETQADKLATSELVERVFPIRDVNTARGATITALAQSRQRVFNILAREGMQSLADCASRGEERPGKFKNMVRPWLWSAPVAVTETHHETVISPCPHCGCDINTPPEPPKQFA